MVAAICIAAIWTSAAVIGWWSEVVIQREEVSLLLVLRDGGDAFRTGGLAVEVQGELRRRTPRRHWDPAAPPPVPLVVSGGERHWTREDGLTVSPNATLNVDTEADLARLRVTGSVIAEGAVDQVILRQFIEQIEPEMEPDDREQLAAELLEVLIVLAEGGVPEETDRWQQLGHGGGFSRSVERLGPWESAYPGFVLAGIVALLAYRWRPRRLFQSASG